MEKVLGALVKILVFSGIGFLILLMVYHTVTQDKIGTNGLIYQKVFHDCIVETKSITRNISTVEDDDSSAIISECRSAALQSSHCVYNGKECI